MYLVLQIVMHLKVKLKKTSSEKTFFCNLISLFGIVAKDKKCPSSGVTDYSSCCVSFNMSSNVHLILN